MVAIAPRIPLRLLEEIERLSGRRLPIAEINRRVGRAAWRLSVPRPSYERVRVLVHMARRLRQLTPRIVARLSVRVGLRIGLPAVLVDRLSEGSRLRLRDRASPAYVSGCRLAHMAPPRCCPYERGCALS